MTPLDKRLQFFQIIRRAPVAWFQPQYLTEFTDSLFHLSLPLQERYPRSLWASALSGGYSDNPPQMRPARILRAPHLRQSMTEIEVDAYVIGIRAESLLILLDRFIEVSFAPERDAQVIHGIDVSGIELQRLPEMNNGLIELVRLKQKVAEVVVSLCVIRTDLQRPCILRQRFVSAAFFCQSDSEIVVAVGKIGVNLDHLSEMHDGLIVPALSWRLRGREIWWPVRGGRIFGDRNRSTESPGFHEAPGLDSRMRHRE